MSRTGPIEAGSTQFRSFLPPFGSISGLFSTENAHANVDSNANSNGNQNANEYVNAHAAGNENENANANSNAATSNNQQKIIKTISKNLEKKSIKNPEKIFNKSSEYHLH